MKRLFQVLFLVWPLFYGVAHSATTATVTPGSWDLYRGTSKLTSHTTQADCVKAAEALGITRNYTCRTRTQVAVTSTTNPVCTAPKPADELRAVACPAGTVGQWSQTLTYSPAPYPECWKMSSWSPATPPAGSCPAEPGPNPDPTAGMWTDLASAPLCAKVTIYPAKTVVDASAAGIPIHEGRCLEATPTTFTDTFWASVKPGDVVTLRAGTYTTKFGEGTWYNAMGETYKKGTAAQPIAVVAAPGEAVTLKATSRPPLVFGNGDRATERAEYLTFAGIDYIGSASCVSGGGHTTNPSGGPDETGGKYIRVVGGSCTITDANSNTMTGMIDFQSDGWKILGVKFRDPPNRAIINNNHGVYIQGGADDVEVAYNDFQLRVGHVIQNHQDGTPKLYERLSIHDNSIKGVNYGDMRGISVINVADASTVSVVGNIVQHVGQGDERNGYWGCMNLYRGQITVTGNVCEDVKGGMNLNGGYGGTRKVTADDNKICPIAGSRVAFEGGASASQLTETGARACP